MENLNKGRLLLVLTILLSVLAFLTFAFLIEYQGWYQCADLDANCDGVSNLVDVSIYLAKASQIAPTLPVVESPIEYSPTMYLASSTVTWVTDTQEVRRALDEFWAERGVLPAGMSSYAGDKCTIYAFEPESRRDFEILGHELAHCLRGNFHQ